MDAAIKKALAQNRYTVSLYVVGVQRKTVVATNAKEAVDMVVKGGGSDGGMDGPTIVMAHSKEPMQIGDPPPTLKYVAQLVGQVLNKQGVEEHKTEAVDAPKGSGIIDG